MMVGVDDGWTDEVDTPADTGRRQCELGQGLEEMSEENPSSRDCRRGCPEGPEGGWHGAWEERSRRPLCPSPGSRFPPPPVAGSHPGVRSPPWGADGGQSDHLGPHRGRGGGIREPGASIHGSHTLFCSLSDLPLEAAFIERLLLPGLDWAPRWAGSRLHARPLGSLGGV